MRDIMIVEMDPDSQLIAEFMQSQMSASKLVAVAKGIVALAPIIWGHFEPETINGPQIAHPPISDGGLPIRQAANGEPMSGRMLNAADKPMHETMRMRVSASLRGMRERGSLVSGEGKGASLLWRLSR